METAAYCNRTISKEIFLKVPQTGRVVLLTQSGPQWILVSVLLYYGNKATGLLAQIKKDVDYLTEGLHWLHSLLVALK